MVFILFSIIMVVGFFMTGHSRGSIVCPRLKQLLIVTPIEVYIENQ